MWLSVKSQSVKFKCVLSAIRSVVASLTDIITEIIQEQLRLFKVCNVAGSKMGKGQNIENQNVESQKEHRKFEKDQNIKSQIRLSTL